LHFSSLLPNGSQAGKLDGALYIFGGGVWVARLLGATRILSSR